MRCLYCGKELALLKRLTGGGEFCSDAHKQSYQEEYNRLALSRLMQANKRAKGAAVDQRAESGSPSTPGAAAVAESVVEEPVEELVVEEVPVEEVEEIVEDAAEEVEETVVEEPVLAAEPEEEEPEEIEHSPDSAGFDMDFPEIVVLEDRPRMYVEPWLDLSAPVAIPDWESSQAMPFTFPNGGLVPVRVPSNIASDSTGPVAAIAIAPAPEEFAEGKVEVNLPLTVKLTHEFPSSDPIAIAFTSKATNNWATNLYQALTFPERPAAIDPKMFEPPMTGWDFPEEDAPVRIPDGWMESPQPETEAETAVIETPVAAATVEAPVEPPPEPVRELSKAEEPEFPATPRAALKALSRLHQDLIQEEAPHEEPVYREAPVYTEAQVYTDPEIVDEPTSRAVSGPVRVSVVRSLPIDEALDVSPPSEPVSSAVAVAEPEPPMLAAPAIEAAAAIDIAAVPVAQPSAPREADHLLEIPIRDFAPAKAALKPEVSALFTQTQPVLPRLKALPLRPKIAPAPSGFKSQSSSPAPQPQAAEEVKVPLAPNLSPEPKEKSKAAKAAAQPEAVATAQAPPAAPVAPEKKAEPARTKSHPVQKSPEKKPAETPQPSVEEKPAPVAATEPKESKPVDDAASEGRAVKVPRANTSRSQEFPSKQNKPEEDLKPAFEALELQFMSDKPVPFWGSLKVKLAIAIVLVTLGIVGFMYLGGKKPVVTQTASDATGPSIMVGEGGWVQNWSGDPIGLRLGREITIYRPSLTLNDYRIEFQGQIENKSIGWVFRAPDPTNYYAMKLALLSNALPLKVGLFKYLVRNGRETEVGRVGLDLPVASDTQFKIRVDVRGSKFNTYIQGQSVDQWTDDQLKKGGVGFLNERGERSRIKSVAISYLSGGTK